VVGTVIDAAIVRSGCAPSARFLPNRHVVALRRGLARHARSTARAATDLARALNGPAGERVVEASGTGDLANDSTEWADNRQQAVIWRSDKAAEEIAAVSW
jgi:hypothetical protein